MNIREEFIVSLIGFIIFSMFTCWSALTGKFFFLVGGFILMNLTNAICGYQFVQMTRKNRRFY